MANDSTNAGQVSSEQDTTPINDGYFTDMQGDADAVFGPEQLAQASAGGAPVVVPVPQDQNVIRVQVSPGEILELSSPFDGGVALLGREADGNLAIRVGDVTVILVGFVEANAAAPVLVETSDGQPIDIAVLLASTDPAIDIQTAAGPGEGPQGQSADNTGAILAQLANGNGLGGLNAVGGQDATELSYGTIDNAIRLDRDDNLATSSLTPFRGVSEPFLRDPVHQGAFVTFDKFIHKYDNYVTNHPGQAWADFEGTQATGDDFESYLSQTSFTSEVAHSSTDSEHFRIDKDALEAFLSDSASADPHPITSDGSALIVEMRDNDTTAFVLRKSDNALVLVFHLHGVDDPDSASGTGNFQIDTYLIDRLDHPGVGHDILSLDIPYEVFVPFNPENQENSEEPPSEGQETIVGSGSTTVDVLDDIPIAGETDYYSFLHATSYKDALACFDVFTHGKISDYLTLSHDAGQVDEDYIFGGNRDKDNATGPDKDDARGDTIGDRFVVGQLHVNFGADGASGQIPHGDKFWEPDGDPIFTDANPQALAIAGFLPGADVPGLKSNGHDLIVLKHETVGTIEILQVGYKPTNDTPSGEGTARTLTDTSSGDVVVFTLLLQTGPNLPLIPFGGFVFEQSEPLDHPVAGTLESNLQLLFPITATDDDGDHPVDPLNIVININDDAPTFQITYTNEDPTNCEPGDGPVTEGFALTGLPTTHVDHYTTKDFGHVDEDWLNGGVRKEALVVANGQGNHDLDGNGDSNANEFGDDKGGVQVCGQIKVKYGADGPSDAENNGDLALKTYDTSDPQNLPLFVNGGEPTTLTSDGHPLVVLQSSEGHLLVGYTTTYEGEGTYTIDHPVFELSLNPSTGKFEFNLLAPIDHFPSTVDGEPESNLVLSFDVGAAEDFDGDKALGAINIKVNDDKPEIGISYFNNLEHDFSNTETEGLVRLSGVASSDVVKTHDYGHVDEDWLKGGSDFSGHFYIGNQDEDGNDISNADKFGDDIGKSEVCGQITVKYGGDGASGTDNPFGLEAYTLPPELGPSPTIEEYNAYQAGLPVFKNVDGTSVFSGGVELHVLKSDGGHLEVGIPGKIIPSPFFGIPDQKMFELDFDPTTNKFDFKQWAPIDHDPQAGPDGPETNSLLTFKVGSVSDNDGDTVDAVIKIQVNDDSPEVSISYTSHQDTSEDGDFTTTNFGYVDEDFLGDPPANTDNDNNPFAHQDADRGDTFGTTSCYGTIGTANFGGDGPGDAASPFVLTHLSGDFKDADNNLVTQNGLQLVVLDSTDDHLAVGLEGGSPVFELTLNGDGTFNFQLYGPLDQTPGNTDPIENNLLLAFDASNGATDGDGDPVKAVIKIQVNDDAPVAVDDCEDLGTVEGNLLTNDPVHGTDKPGADGFRMTDGLVTAVTHIKALDSANVVTAEEDVADTGETTIQGVFGVLTLLANGNWSYELDDPDVKGSDIFEYTLTDGDGDTDTAQLIVTTGIVEAPDEFTETSALRVAAGPTHTVADSYDLNLTTYLSTDATKDKGYHPGDSVEINDTSLLGLTILGAANHTLKGGSGDDHIMGNAGDDNLQGRDGNDILEGGDGRDQLHGGAGDDTLYGGNNDDELYGDAGHDAMSGGDGNDKLHADADDLDGTNTLDGTHAIDGGDGTDTVDLSVLKTFDSSQAMHLENVEHLALEGNAAGGGGTAVTLNYGAAYGITEVGGLHQLSITGDKSDTLNLQASGGNAWHETGLDTHIYEAGIGASKVTVTVDHDIAVQVS